MTYCTQADLEAAFGVEAIITTQPLATPPADPPVVDVAAVAAAIQAATDEIDSYVMQRYTLTLAAELAARLKRRCLDLAMYHLAPTVSSQDDVKHKRYDDAVEWLQKLADGDVVLEPRPAVKMTSEERREFHPDPRYTNNPYSRRGRRGRFS